MKGYPAMRPTARSPMVHQKSHSFLCEPVPFLSERLDYTAKEFNNTMSFLISTAPLQYPNLVTLWSVFFFEKSSSSFRLYQFKRKGALER